MEPFAYLCLGVKAPPLPLGLPTQICSHGCIEIPRGSDRMEPTLGTELIPASFQNSGNYLIVSNVHKARSICCSHRPAQLADICLQIFCWH
jgi:hypothetical protein